MTRKIPVLIDEEVYYHLQQLDVPHAKDLGEVVRYLLLQQQCRDNGTPATAERLLRRLDLLAELHGSCGRVANDRQLDLQLRPSHRANATHRRG